MNRLSREKSPYLLQHAENPVDWRPWGPEAFERAQAEDKPVFLSIGYSTCHWCHVMAHESFEDRAAAEVINAHFIPVKVDREERPDVDAVYMAACVAMNGSGGWPLTVLLTPEQKPFWAGTYLPKKQLISLLTQVSRLWSRDRENLLSAGEEMTAYLRREEHTRPGTPQRALAELAVVHLGQGFDRVWGGFGAAPKFPIPHNLLFLLRYARLAGDAAAGEMAERTLEGMYRGGLFDHVGGGFSRYSTDGKWLIPHFEKMLYDNALLVLAYTEAYQQTRRPLWGQVARRTLDYVLAELTDPQGGFYCGQDADSDGAEGKYYLLSTGELGELLGRENAAAFCRWYGVTPEGNFEGKSIPNLITQSDIDREPEGMGTLRELVYAYRLERTRLHRDDKVLAAWNGLAIAALARAGLVLEEPRYLDAAERASKFLKQALTDSEGHLLARWREGDAAHPGKLDDYAFCACGLLELYAATLRPEHLAEAARLAGLLLDLFSDERGSGLYPYPSDAEQLITRNKETYDGAMPSGNSAAALVFSRLARLTGQGRWRSVADRQLAYLAGVMEPYPEGHSFALLALLEELWPSAELVCATQEVPEALLDFLRERPRPELSVLVKTPLTEPLLTRLAPFTADYPTPPSGVKYYLCRGQSCAQPVETIGEVRRLLEEA
ncbi:MAG TPA: thioredoxin domain-containing protein [Pseudoflavonifractor sp.]|nr:thioredoxin domain-containing protein [Pseudoflavonifractor sp.]